MMFSKALARAMLSSGTTAAGRLAFADGRRRPLLAFSFSCCSCLCLPSQPFNGISLTPQFVWCLQRLANLAVACCFAARNQRRLTLPLSSTSSQQVALYQQPAAAAAARPNRQTLLLVLDVASAWAARIRLAHAIQAAGRERRLQQEARDLLKGPRSKVLQQLIQVRCKYYSRLDRYDKRAIRDYTGNGFDAINRTLRGDGAPSAKKAAKAQAQIDGLVRALTKTKVMTTHVGTVFRGTKKLPASILDQLRPGATFCDPAFLSTSVERRVAYGIANGAILFEIESKSGVDVSKHSKSQYEAEVLFQPGTVFMIKSVEYGVDGLDHLVKMTELF